LRNSIVKGDGICFGGNSLTFRTVRRQPSAASVKTNVVFGLLEVTSCAALAVEVITCFAGCTGSYTLVTCSHVLPVARVTVAHFHRSRERRTRLTVYPLVASRAE
jgi:hypothetical protein